MILENIPKRYINVTWSHPEKSQLECALSRGDTRMCKVIEGAWKNGAKFDNWTDIFDLNAWTGAFEKNGIAIDFYTTRGYDVGEVLPWDNIDMGIKEGFLLLQYRKALDLAGNNKVGT